MRKKISKNKKVSSKPEISLSVIMTGMVIIIVLISILLALLIFVKVYQNSMEENAITSSEQAVVQVANTVARYTEDMDEVMGQILEIIQEKDNIESEFFENLLEIRSDIVSITMYDENGNLTRCWSGEYELKEKINQNLSYMEIPEQNDKLNISKPHAESLFVNYYPWVVTIAQYAEMENGEKVQVAMDIRFSEIANYVDDVGIGQHGYCFIINEAGDIIYHPQQQLIYSGLKDENTAELQNYSDGSYTQSNVISTIRSLENCDWRIVSYCYVDEMIISKVKDIIWLLLMLMLLVLVTAILSSFIFSKLFSNPAKRLAKAMREFEKNAPNFQFSPVASTSEVKALSDSFGHMVVQIQQLVEKVRQEEVTLRKTELNALQSQINPHFLYNTLDSIAWLCEEGRNQDAVFMVNALARLFRISISRGYELIPIEKELQHAESYLKIQKFRYKNQFTYSIEVDEECHTYYCNKIMLQPMIENAIYHGLDRMVDEGSITIRVFQNKEDIVMLVEDNGVGMTQQQCREILHKEPGSNAGIGIKNVNDRIKIYFGEKYGLTIESEPDVGTKVWIRIPRVTEVDL